ADGEGNVLRIVEHLAVVIGNRQQQQRGDETGPLAAEGASELPGADDAEDAECAVEQVASLVSAEWRNPVQRGGDGVEGGTIILEVEPVEAATVVEQSEVGIEAEDAVPVVHVFVPGHAVIG